jgi:hypothetical protein
MRRAGPGRRHVKIDDHAVVRWPLGAPCPSPPRPPGITKERSDKISNWSGHESFQISRGSARASVGVAV